MERMPRTQARGMPRTQARGSASRQRMTWAQICAEYPDRWVVLVDVDWTNKDGDFRTAIVLGAGAGRDATLRRFDPIKAGYLDFAHSYTGRVRSPQCAINMVLP